MARRAAVALAALALAACATQPGTRTRDIARKASSGAAQAYVVQPGDTFRAIADRFGLPMATLAGANGIASPYLVRIGQVLRVPRPAPQATPAPLAAPAPVAPAARIAGAPRFAWPTDGALATGFGAIQAGRASRGIDLAAFRGMAVRATAAGRVLFAGTEPERYGQLVILDHGGGWTSAYAYLGKLTVKEGDTVARRDRIGTVGDTGAAKRPTLHFELRQDNRPVNPESYLPLRL